MFNRRTNYSIIDEYGNKSTVTIDKLTADTLQEALPDVHNWIQAAYNCVAKRKPFLGRIQKGDIVRLLAQKEAEKYPPFYRKIEELLGVSF
ncbi:MAG: hypothetical protein EB015_20440 [Methylocystaceae bacterium]|nr:hypothetical protein [Methylocystaceae bacterium]